MVALETSVGELHGEQKNDQNTDITDLVELSEFGQVPIGSGSDNAAQRERQPSKAGLPVESATVALACRLRSERQGAKGGREEVPIRDEWGDEDPAWIVKTKVELGGVSGFSGNRSPFRDREAESPNTATYGISTFRSTDMKKLLAPQFTVEMLHLRAGLHSTVEALFINEGSDIGYYFLPTAEFNALQTNVDGNLSELENLVEHRIHTAYGSPNSVPPPCWFLKSIDPY
ncbi:hypothetical protein C8J57DRAFT_1255410 [Mycena rebaudengoi]|nr:hypothetical protein C8J57DRAFT_1255410 [Mycena rebaudengoi]